MWPKPVWQGLCVADAYAAGSNAGIGGAIFLPSGACTWFSLQLQHSDFKSLSIPIHEDLQKDIASLETLAQIALVFITIQQFPGACIPIKIPTLSDNTGAGAVSNKLFTTNLPLALRSWSKLKNRFLKLISFIKNYDFFMKKYNFL